MTTAIAHVVTGSLGSGKTTAILHLLKQVPANESWAVVVNEFGAVGIDGATFAGEGIAVREIAGGCICCLTGPQLRLGLVQLLRERRPHRVIIEPSGLANPSAIIDMLRSPGLREAVSLGSTLTLVDIRKFGNPSHPDTFHAQVEVADILLGTFAEVSSELQQQAFLTWASSLWPPKTSIVLASHAELALELLNTAATSLPKPKFFAKKSLVESHILGAQSIGWVFPSDICFDRAQLERALQQLLRPSTDLPEGILRMKGLFRVSGRWLKIDATSDRIQSTPSGWRTDSRVEFLLPSSNFNANAIESQIRAAIVQRSK